MGFYLVILLILELFNTSFIHLVSRLIWWPAKESKHKISCFLGLSTLSALWLSTILVLKLLGQMKIAYFCRCLPLELEEICFVHQPTSAPSFAFQLALLFHRQWSQKEWTKLTGKMSDNFILQEVELFLKSNSELWLLENNSAIIFCSYSFKKNF